MYDLDEGTLRSLFARATEGEEPPLGSLADDAKRTAVTVRRRQWLVRGTGGLVAAAVLAAAIPVLGAVMGSGAGPVRLQTAAFVAGRVEKAVAGERYVLHAESTVTGAGVSGRVVTWAYRGRTRSEQYRPNGGQLETDSGTAIIGGKLSGVVVTYHPGRWYRVPLRTFTGGPVSGCGPAALAVAGANPPDWPSFIHATLACGAATVAGHAKVNGVETIKISSDVTVAVAGTADGARLKVEVRYTLYVRPGTYLPVRMVSQPVQRYQNGKRSPASFSSTENFQWLPPTAANVANVTVPIPAGFRQLHLGIHPGARPTARREPPSGPGPAAASPR